MSRLRAFLSADPRLLAFGAATTFGSSFGQTYFIALSGGEIRDAFALTHGDFGAVYSIATLASAASLIWTGKLIDRLDLRVMSAGVTLGLALACALMGLAESVVLLGVAIYMLRQFGQGLMSHTGSTSMARYFEAGRGRAIGVSGIGFPLGEGLFPILAVAVMAWAGWRDMWLLCGAAMAFVFLPAQQWLLAGHSARQSRYRDRVAAEERAEAEADRTRAPGERRAHWTRPEVLRDPRFYLVLPAALAPSFIVTGVFFHQVHLVEVKGWSLAWYSAAFMAFAGATVPAGLIYGALIDRIGAVRALPLFLPPLAAACVVLALWDHPLAIWAFMPLAGMSAGMSQTLSAALWAEVYGTRHIGAIKALTTALMVLSTAASPWAIGALIDIGVGLEAILLLCAGYAALGVGLSFAARGRYRSPALQGGTA